MWSYESILFWPYRCVLTFQQNLLRCCIQGWNMQDIIPPWQAIHHINPVSRSYHAEQFWLSEFEDVHFMTGCFIRGANARACDTPNFWMHHHRICGWDPLSNPCRTRGSIHWQYCLSGKEVPLVVQWCSLRCELSMMKCCLFSPEAGHSERINDTANLDSAIAPLVTTVPLQVWLQQGKVAGYI